MGTLIGRDEPWRAGGKQRFGSDAASSDKAIQVRVGVMASEKNSND